MTEERVREMIRKQRAFYRKGSTLSAETRIRALLRLRGAVQKYEKEISQALYADLGKSEAESYFCEIGLVLDELTYMIRHVRRFAAKKRVMTPPAQFAAASFVRPEPYGNVLVMSPWNYPFLLAIDPLIDAVAAGNTVIIKPSAYAPAVSKIIERVVADAFSVEYAAVVQGGRAENEFLLDQKFDKIFFTGSQEVGKEVLRRAADHLTPVTLELGGKSPCIVDETAKIRLAARRIVFGKFLNCGQTCVAPDYILCHESIKDELIAALKKEIKRQFGTDPLQNAAYGKIINRKHFDRLRGLIDPNKLAWGGKSDEETLKIEPTILTGVTERDGVMGEEIFGPILPILTFRKIEEIPKRLEGRMKPLAFYVFSESRARVEFLHMHCHFGGGCINDVVVHLASPYFGFGGVGESGMGAYHGKEGFRCFSHRKSIMDKKTWMDLPMRYQPYRKPFVRLVRLILN